MLEEEYYENLGPVIKENVLAYLIKNIRFFIWFHIVVADRLSNIKTYLTYIQKKQSVAANQTSFLPLKSISVPHIMTPL